MKHFPVYHFRPGNNWINDPNGPIYFEGAYHLFYQYNPYGGAWDTMHWGHAVSQDLIHWEYGPIALTPDNEKGEYHCFSGTSFINNDKVELFYTSISDLRRGKYSSSQCIATTDDMVTWKRIKENPVLDPMTNDSNGLFLSDWRDPFVFEYKSETLMVIAGVQDGWKKAVHIYRSKDKRHWEYLNVFYSANIDTVVECPNVALFEDKVALLYTPLMGHVKYVVGTINEDYSLNVISHGDIEDKGGYYATNLFLSADGRPLLWGWIREDDRKGIYTDGEWSGLISLPREIGLNDKDELMMRPAKEVNILRKEAEYFEMNEFEGVYTFATQGKEFEIEAELEENGEITFRVLADRYRREYTDICIDSKAKNLCIVRKNSSLIPEVEKDMQKGTFNRSGDKVKVNIFVDRSVIEIFINEQYAYTARVYPINQDDIIQVFAAESKMSGKVKVYKLGL